uniref:Uncharacterized protein n=1 Tax=Cajanus cajan TaxID=3821 RepID=A0A151TIH8_CAJCA|nr:hypothetical protein KK1_013171 [Cajanus cajan]
MGEFRAMHKYLTIFVALFACHGSLFAHGRQIKPLNQHSWLNTNTEGHSIINVSDDLKVTEGPIVPKYEFAEVGSDSGAHYGDAFRPTTPGSSPGVGHKKFEEEKGMKVMGVLVHSPDVKVSVINGFSPTEPGHSPGVGHPRQNKSGKQN